MVGKATAKAIIIFGLKKTQTPFRALDFAAGISSAPIARNLEAVASAASSIRMPIFQGKVLYFAEIN